MPSLMANCLELSIIFLEAEAQIVILNVIHPSCPPAVENIFNLLPFQCTCSHLVQNHETVASSCHDKRQKGLRLA